jgi:hypothetical protein
LAVGACTHTPEQVAVAADALQTASLPGSVTLSTKTTTVVPGEPVTIEDKRDWIEMPYAVTRAELKELYAMPPIETAPQFQFSTLVPPGAELWDPFDIHVQSSESFLVGDDAKSGRIWQVNIDGSVKSVAAPERFAHILLISHLRVLAGTLGTFMPSRSTNPRRLVAGNLPTR